MIFKIVDKITYWMQVLSGALVVLMMVTVLLDVVSRFVVRVSNGSLNVSFIGAIEIVKFSLLFAIFFALPYFVDRSQVVVDLFTEKLSDRSKWSLDIIYYSGYAVLGAGMCSQFYQSAVRTSLSGQTTQDLLIPMSYIYGVITFATLILTLRSLLVAQSYFVKALRSST